MTSTGSRASSRAALYCAYMPFIENGGIFIPTTKPYALGAEVFMLLRLTQDGDDKPALAAEIARVRDGTADKPVGVRFEESAHHGEPDSFEKIPVAGKVVWITPANAQDGRVPGIGIQFSKLDRGATRHRIEALLRGALKSERRTHTM